MAEFVIERAQRTQSRLRLALTATSNGGKTWSSILVAKGIVEYLLEEGKLSGTLEGKIGIIDTERKSAPLYAHLAPFDCIHLDPPYTAARYAAALKVFEDAGYPVVIIDQISHAWAGPGGMLALLNQKAKNQFGGNTFTAFSEITPEQDAFIDRLLSSPAHLIVTMRQKTEWVLEAKEGRDGKSRMSPRRIGTKPVQRDGVEYEFTTLLGLDTDTHLARPLKNRCPVFQDGVGVLLDEKIGHSLAEWMLGGAPLSAEAAAQPTALESASAGVSAAEEFLPKCANLPDLARRFETAWRALMELKGELEEGDLSLLAGRLKAVKDARKAALQGAGVVVRDLPPDIGASQEERTATPKEVAERIVEKIADSRGGLFAGVKDDLPWQD